MLAANRCWKRSQPTPRSWMLSALANVVDPVDLTCVHDNNATDTVPRGFRSFLHVPHCYSTARCWIVQPVHTGIVGHVKLGRILQTSGRQSLRAFTFGDRLQHSSKRVVAETTHQRCRSHL